MILGSITTFDFKGILANHYIMSKLHESITLTSLYLLFAIIDTNLITLYFFSMPKVPSAQSVYYICLGVSSKKRSFQQR